MTRTNIELVCFDLGGVLIRVVRGWDEACRIAGLPVHALFDSDMRAVLDEASYAMEVGELTPDEFLATICEHSDYTRHEAESVFDAWLIETYQGIGPFLEGLRRIGAGMALLSNTNARHWGTIADPASAFAPVLTAPHRFVSHEIGTRKPDDAAFAEVERRTGVAPGRILFFDDSKENVNAASLAGWCVERIDPARDTVAQMTHHLQHYGVTDR